MTPPINIDGESGYGSVTIDGQTVDQITIDGQDVFSTIPDSEDLHAHFDASDKSDVSTTWENETSEADLQANSNPSIQTNDKNGLNTVKYDGTDDYHATDWNSTLTQPYHMFIVFKSDSTSDDPFLMGGQGPNGSTRSDVFLNYSSNYYQLDGGGNAPQGGSTDTNWHIANIRLDGANSNNKIDIDGTNVVSGGDGTSDQDGISLAELLRQTGFHFTGRIGEFLEYNTDKTAIESDVESYLSDKWGITV